MTDITVLPNRREPCHRNPDGSSRITHGDSLQDLAQRERRIVEVVSRCFAIGTVRRTARLAGGVLNEVYLAETSRDRFVIRVNRVRRSVAEIERLSSFLASVGRLGIPVDGLVPAADGRVAAEIDGELLSVHRYIPGTVYPSPQDLTGTQAANMMTFLAVYHSAAADYRITGRLAARDEMLPVMYTEDPDRLRGRFESLPKTTRVVESIVNGAIDRLASFFASRLCKELERTWIHGDYRSCNVAFDGDSVSGLFDWDLLCNGPRLVDVVVASNDLARMIVGPLSLHPEMWQQNFAGHLAAYRKKARRLGTDITESEVRSIPCLLIADTILSGVLFALYLRKLPLKPGESAGRRRQRSDRLLSDSVDDLITIDRQIANGTAMISVDT